MYEVDTSLVVYGNYTMNMKCVKCWLGSL